MKRMFLLPALVAFLAGCATPGSNGVGQADPVHGPNSVYSDPTYPGPGVRFGIGVGSWGGRGGAGVGLGMGF